MKKAWQTLYHHELLSDFIVHGLLILFSGVFLLFHIIKAFGESVIFSRNIRLTEFFIVAVFAIMLLSVISLYKISASYIKWYKGILDSVPMPIIITDDKAHWQQANNAAREIMCQEPDSDLEYLSSNHLIDDYGNIMKTTVTYREVEYRVIGSRLQYNDKDTGYLIILDNARRSNSCETRDELIDDINKLLGRLGTATEQFHDCASSLADCTVEQAGIINNLTDVISGIASGEIQEPDALNKKMHTVKMNLKQHVENNQASFQAVMQTVKELDATRDCIDNAINSIDDAFNSG